VWFADVAAVESVEGALVIVPLPEAEPSVFVAV
jgi:hypothetical protein